MTVAVDAVSSAATTSSTGGTTTTHTNLTVGSSLTNGALIFFVTFAPDSGTAASVPTAFTWNGVSMTDLGHTASDSAFNNGYIFGLRNPASGNQTFSLTWTGAGSASIFGISFSGVEPSSDANAFKNFTAAGPTTSATASVTLASAVGNISLGLFLDDDTATFSTTTNTASLYLQNASANKSSAASRQTGAASNTMNYSLTSHEWVAAAIDIVAASGAAAAPFVQSVWEKAAFQITKPDFNRPLNVNLFTNPIPVNNAMLLIGSSKVKYVLSDSTDPSEMWLFPQVVAAPFYIQDFSTSRILPNWLPSPTYPNLTIINTKPFDNSTPGRMWTIIAGPPQSLPLNLNLFTNPIPFAQYDWSTYRNIPDWLPPTAYPNLVVNTTVVFNPFIPIDYNRTFTPVPAKPDQQALNINLYTNPIPFGPYDYPRISAVRYTPFDVNGLPNLVLNFSTPFVSYDWSKPRAVKASIDPQYPNFVILQPVGSPFSQLDWSKAYTISPKASNQNEVPNLLLIQPSIPGRPLGLSNWLNIGYVKSPVIIVPDQNNLPNIVLPNTTPVPPVIFIPGGKTVWVPRWGEKQRRQYGDREAFNEVRKAAAVLSSLGGHARAKSLTSKERSNIASIAAKARWR